MKISKLLSLCLLVLPMAAPIHAKAETEVMGRGAAVSAIPPACDDGAMQRAKQAADENAAKQCGAGARRINEYLSKCTPLVHGYAARAEASASYVCGN